MKKLTFITLVFASVLFITSCGEAKKEVKDEVKKEVKDEVKKEVKKADHFAEIDLDENGKVTKEEFSAHSKVEFTEKDANKDGKIQKEECGKFDMFNKDGDDFLSEEEFVNGHDGMFAKIDTDADGSFTKADMKAFQVSMKTKKFKAKFTKVDADKDGKASKDEFLSFSKVEFKEKDAKGNNDGKLQKEECGGFATVSPDGKDLTIEEFVSARADAFESIDADNDGSFTAEDFVAFKLSTSKKAHKESKMKCEAGKCGK